MDSSWTQLAGESSPAAAPTVRTDINVANAPTQDAHNATFTHVPFQHSPGLVEVRNDPSTD